MSGLIMWSNLEQWDIPGKCKLLFQIDFFLNIYPKMTRIKRQVRISIDCAKGKNDATFPPSATESIQDPTKHLCQSFLRK